jgi:hypothetical protein
MGSQSCSGSRKRARAAAEGWHVGAFKGLQPCSPPVFAESRAAIVGRIVGPQSERHRARKTGAVQHHHLQQVDCRPRPWRRGRYNKSPANGRSPAVRLGRAASGSVESFAGGAPLQGPGAAVQLPMGPMRRPRSAGGLVLHDGCGRSILSCPPAIHSPPCPLPAGAHCEAAPVVADSRERHKGNPARPARPLSSARQTLRGRCAHHDCDRAAAPASTRAERPTCAGATMVAHNNVLPNAHFKKKWGKFVRTWFNQPARKIRRRQGRGLLPPPPRPAHPPQAARLSALPARSPRREGRQGLP